MSDLIKELQDESDLCRNEGVDDLAELLDVAAKRIIDQQAEIARLKLFEPGRRAKPMDKPVQIASTKFSYWGIVDKEECSE